RHRHSDPFNDVEPVDSSAAAIAAQGMVRLGALLERRGQSGTRYSQAGLHVLETLIDPSGPYLSQDSAHQGLLLHAIYHRPNGWDAVPAESGIPRGESCQWGDYHLRELALYVKRLASGEPHLSFFNCRHLRPVALSTGGTRGIGLGMAEALAADGWDLALCGLRSEDEVAGVVTDLARSGASVTYCRADVSIAVDRSRLLDEVIARHGR